MPDTAAQGSPQSRRTAPGLGRIARDRALASLLGFWFRPTPRSDLVELGNPRASWTIPADFLAPSAVCYCGGAGEDISFDLALVEHYGCHVWAFDPTPAAIRYIESLPTPDQFHFLAYGLWSKETELRFYSPADPSHVSHSALNLARTQDYFVAACKPITAIMKELHHDHLTLLKLDIEGAEYEVLNEVLGSGLRPTILCVEFDQPMPVLHTVHMLRRILLAGYTLVARRGWNYTFAQA